MFEDCQYITGRLGPRGILRKLFIEEFPTGDLDKLEKVLSKYKEDEIERLADAVCRFGLIAILDAVEEVMK